MQAAIPLRFVYEVKHPTREETPANGSLWNTATASLSSLVNWVAQQRLKEAFLPWSAKKTPDHLRLNQRLGEETAQALMDPAAQHLSDEQLRIKTAFAIRDIQIELKESSGPSKHVTVREFTSSKAGEKDLRFFLFSFNGNGEEGRWIPSSLDDLSQTAFDVLEALRSQGVVIDSLLTHSLGNAILDRLKNDDKLPDTLIINRGLASIAKLANRIAPFPFNHILLRVADICGWNANPESNLLDFLTREKAPAGSTNLTQRKIVILEAQLDHYFSGKAALDKDTITRIHELGHEVFSASFYTIRSHHRAHHSMPLDDLQKNELTNISLDTMRWDLKPHDNMASVLARKIFKEGGSCVCVTGNGETLDIATANLVPLLDACAKIR